VRGGLGEQEETDMQSCLNGATLMPYSLEQHIASAARAGFAAVELWGDKFEQYFKDGSIPGLAELLQAHRIEPTAIDYVAVDLDSPEPLAATMATLRRYGEIAKGIGCDTVLLIVGGRRPELSKAETLNYLAKLMLPLCDLAGRYGLQLALEPLGGDALIPGPLEALEIIETSKQENLGLAWDFIHFHKSGVPLADIRRIPPRRLLIVHANDVPAKEPATLTDADRVWPGEGVMPIDDYLEILREKRYRGPISVEVFNPQYWRMDPDTIAREAFESLEEYMLLRA
jgi:2-keto-myo-inositol isomerase